MNDNDTGLGVRKTLAKGQGNVQGTTLDIS